ncbi:MAG: FtsX-like permease family protein [Gemmataceae bacterium]|nr:FtsX-like permease family protein [Gemmataceae bacterium]
MTFFQLLLRNLVYHRRGNTAVLLGAALGTAVLTGALLVGDSLRGSLRSLALDQLGWVDQALVNTRFFRAALADGLPAHRRCAALLLQGSAVRESPLSPKEKGEGVVRAGKAVVLGVDAAFWQRGPLPLDETFWQADAAETVLNAHLAGLLQAKTGDTITLYVQRSDDIPRESLLGKRNAEDVLLALEVKVRAVLPEQGLGRFSLKLNPAPPRNAFVPLRFLQEKLGLAGRANAILLGHVQPGLQEAVKKNLTLDDWNLKVTTPADRARAWAKFLDPRNLDQGNIKKVRWKGRVPPYLTARPTAEGLLPTEEIIDYYQSERRYLTLESSQSFLDPHVEKTGRLASRSLTWVWGKEGMAYKPNDTPVLVYLADSIAPSLPTPHPKGAKGEVEIPYAIVAGMRPHDLPLANELQPPLQDGEILLAQWTDSPFLSVKPGDKIALRYFYPDRHNHLELREETFVLRGTFPLEGRADDPDFTPEFPGITDKQDMANWENPPFPYDAKRIKPADESFWKRYKTTPRAYITLATAQSLWANRFGKVTALRLALDPRWNVAPAVEEYTSKLLAMLSPADGGFVFQPMKEAALKAGAGSSDFSMLFLGFSFFLIVASLLLVGLLFRLSIDRRANEMGLLLATGWRHGQVRRLLFGEGVALAVVGGALGLAGALLYAALMLELLRAHWPGGENLVFLHLHIGWLSLAAGYAASILMSVLTILWATRLLARLSPRSLLAGETVLTSFAGSRSTRWSSLILGVAIVGAACCFIAGFSVTGHEAQAGSFFGSGALLLSACLALLWRWLKRAGTHSSLQPSIALLGMRNAGRHPLRSLLTAGLLAAATFLIVAVQSFQKETGDDFFHKDGGSGGFPLLAESDVPIFEDLNLPAVRKPMKLPAWFEEVQIYSCRVRAGDDTSCLNLYQPLQPRVVGVSEAFIERGGFRFASYLGPHGTTLENPWTVLQQERSEFGDWVPALADASAAQWILKVSLGGFVQVTNDQGTKTKLKIVGLLQESIFQSELLIADDDFLQHFPRREGFSFFLIDGPLEYTTQIQRALESALGAQGFFATPTVQRLEAYHAVENMYLATFQALGRLGLLLGAVGLAIVLLRGVWERRGELALLQALGFRRQTLVWLVLAENLWLLLAGLAAGTLAALVAVAPHLAGAGGAVLGLRLLLLLGMVVAVGLAAGIAAAVSTLRAPLLSALRRE